MNPTKRIERSIKRFWNRIDIRGPNDCWYWKGKLNQYGQGQFPWNKKPTLVHRIAMELHLGRPLVSPTSKLKKEGEVVRHTCDVSFCVNPKHLLLGTQADNIRDRDKRGRTSIGEHRYNHKLTEAAVTFIRTNYVWYSKTSGAAAFARKYKVHPSTVEAVLKKEVWKHV